MTGPEQKSPYPASRRADVGGPRARDRRHICGKGTCAGCSVCADPGPRGVCSPCSRGVTRTAPTAAGQS